MNKLMGILNLTLDSFSDGGKFFHQQTALAQAEKLITTGADMIDIGAESTRPGALRVSETTELERIVPVVKILAQKGVIVSVDTMRSKVADRALAAGAKIINDVSAGQADSNMFMVVRKHQAQIVLNHWINSPRPAENLANIPLKTAKIQTTTDIISSGIAWLTDRITVARQVGIKPENIILDPGIGFSKTSDQSWDILANLSAYQKLGYPILVGVSRKKFLTELLQTIPALTQETQLWTAADIATAIITANLAEKKIWGFRVHDVLSSKIALEISKKIKRF